MFGGRKQTVSCDQVDTILGQGAEYTGTIKGSGTIRIDGTMSGDIQITGDVIVSDSGRLTANIEARHVIVAGRIEGDLELSGQLEIASTGKVLGQIKVASLIVAEGGVLAGNCIMSESGSSSTRVSLGGDGSAKT